MSLPFSVLSNMATAWTREQMSVLIDAMKEEQCLYNVKSKNYYNKRCRAEALFRVFFKVKCVRPHLSNPKECQTKFLNMRNMFNVENRKRKESMRTATCEDDIYRPGLWYFQKLEFLGAHYMPRIRNSAPLQTMECSDSFQTDESTSHESDVVESSMSNVIEFTEESDVKDIGLVESDSILEQVPLAQTSWSSAESATSRSSTARKRNNSDSYDTAIQLIVDRLQESYDDDITVFVKYLATEMRQIKCREARNACKQKILKIVYDTLDNE
ncbi:uncharacterized protein LOC126473784 [Schistocerca serialis cubense]|uniref:uncharacterized protein LOC126473784 n=1 Tax=Schistocerca serialis cubense TaxID=2023355 RepID=UPI00214E7C3F|nr:uncharacterized protein LOC126473784 [Schistocerca serialis cubense]